MALQDKLVKALEALRNSMLKLQPPDLTARKKEKLINIPLVTDIVCNPTVRNVPNFPNLLSATLEVFLQLCDDSESDVRMLVDESLNRVIRAMTDRYIAKVQVELNEEIKKNGSARTLRAALSRFAQLSHLIRPQKGKAFIQNLVPSILKIAAREEESVLETLDLSLVKIMKALGYFATDNEIKILLRVFLKNLTHNSPVVRRTGANSILTVCLNSKKPNVFIKFVLNTILDMIIPVKDGVSVSLLLGVFGCLRSIIPHATIEEYDYEMDGSFGKRKDQHNIQHPVDRFVQIYEISLFYLSHSDHNVINAALETLHILLENPGEKLLLTLLSPNGISRSRISTVIDGHMNLKVRSMSEMSVANSDNAEDLISSMSECAPDVEHWIQTSKLAHLPESESTELLSKSLEDRLSLNNYFDEPLDPKPINEPYSNLVFQNINDNESIVSNSTNHDEIINPINRELSIDELDNLSIKSEESERICTPDTTPVKDVFIGEFTDENIPLIFCTRKLVKLFLLTGFPRKLMSDSLVRVSVKSLALTCLAQVFQIFPDACTLYLDKNYCVNERVENINLLEEQEISDILLYAYHHDPQLRGIVRMLVAAILKSVFRLHYGSYDNWKNGLIRNRQSTLDLSNLIDILNKGLDDESSTCNKQTLLALKTCLPDLLASTNSKSTIPILESLTGVVKNPYWLVKVQLVELLQHLSYLTIYHVTGNSEFQDKVLHNVLYHLLRNDDLRVRSSAAKAIVNIIPNLFYQKEQPQHLPVTAQAIDFKLKYMHSMFDIHLDYNVNQKHFISTMPLPFSALNKQGFRVDKVEKSLARVITHLEMELLESNSKYLTYGCCEVLSLLSEQYFSTIYNKAWNCAYNSNKNKSVKATATLQRLNSQVIETSLLSVDQPVSNSVNSGLLHLSVSMMTTAALTEDISTQQWLLILSGNLFSGISIENLKPVEVLNHERCHVRKPWDIYSDPNFGQITEQLLVHVVKLLNIFTHVLDEVVPQVPSTKPTLPSLPNAPTLSPIKRKPKPDPEKGKLISPGKQLDKEEKSDRKPEPNKIHQTGYFMGNSHYIKIYDILKTAYGNYKLTLDETASEKFLRLLKIVLKTLSQILEMCTIQECGRIAEELLRYLETCANFEPVGAINCVQQLLKCLFGTNLCAQMEDVIFTGKREVFRDGKSSYSDANSFYSNVFQQAYNKFIYCISFMDLNKKDKDDMLGGYIRRKSDRKSSLTFKNLTRSADKTTLANYIRLFEPMVIKSLKEYKITSDIRLQCHVLQLLSQLLQLRVNYCLLDSEQIFIHVVLTQFEIIEEGLIPNPEKLIPKIFNFLVHLSYENQHTKSIIGVPKIINLCDALMASGQSPITNCIPAIRPIISDIFLFRGRNSQNHSPTELKELETTKDFLFNMLLRLVEYHQVLELLTLIVSENKYDNGERWSKWSKLIVDALIPLLKQRRVRLDSREAQVALHSLLCELHPNVYKAMEPLLLVLLQDPPFPENSLSTMHCWMGSVLAILFTLSSVREDVVLYKLNSIRIDIPIRSVYTKLIENYDPLNVTSSSQSIHNILPEEIFSRFLFRVSHVMCERCLLTLDDYLIEQFSTFLLFCIYIFERGNHCKIANTTINLLKNPSGDNRIPLNEINNLMLQLGAFVPILTFQWCYILTILGFSEQSFWSRVFQTIENDNIIHLRPDKLVNKHNSDCINLEIVRQGGIILYSDYICENISDCENLTWFLVNHIETIISLSLEPPVTELIAAIHRNSAASGLFVQAVAARCQELNQPHFVNKLLKSLENVHPTQSGPLLVFLVSNLLNCRQVALSRLNVGLASRRTEMLLTMTIEEVTTQLSKDDLTQILEILLHRKLAKKHQTFVGLLNKLASKYYDLSPLELDQGRTVNPESVRKIVTNKAWYLSQVKLRCCQSSYLGPESAELLVKLPYDDIIGLMSQKEFNKLILKDCIQLSLENSDGEGVQETDLLKATVEILMKHIAYIKSLVPKSHQVYNVTGKPHSPSESKYTNRLNELFSDPAFWTAFYEIVNCIAAYLELITHSSIQATHMEDLMKFSVLTLESLTYLIKTNHVIEAYIESSLLCASNVFKISSTVFDANPSWICSAINSLYILVNYYLLNYEPLPSLSKFGLIKTFENIETQAQGNACHQISIMVAWLEQLQKKSVHNIPEPIFILIRSLIISLSRLGLVNSYVLTPPDVWEQRWGAVLGGKHGTQVPPLPVEFLQEIEVLEQFIFRVLLIGWVNRQQFEEIWMCLLSVLSNESFEENSEDITAKIQANSLAVQAITSLLMQTLLLPVPGNPNVSQLLHVPREKDLSDKCSLSTKKLISVQNKLHWHYAQCSFFPNGLNLVNIFDRVNLDKVNQPTNKYTYGQVSVEYLWAATNQLIDPKSNSKTVKSMEFKNKCLEESALDINSCLQFLLELYSQWTKPENETPLRLLNEVIRSMLAISDLFTDKAQFQWMLDVCLALSKTHPIGDDVWHQYIVLGVCKAAAVVIPEMEVYESVKRILELSLKSNFLPERIASLHGILYLLQSSAMSNTIIGGMSDELLLIHPIAIDYIQDHITFSNSTLHRYQDHQQIMWALVFYLLEHVEEQIADTEIVPNVLQVVLILLSQNTQLSMILHNTLLQGLERLTVANSITGNVVEQATKLAVDKLKHPNPAYALPALQLLLACMYMEGEKQINAPKNKDGIVEMDPDLLVQFIEKISAIFERIRKGYPFEAKLLCTVLPNILNDFFPPSEILTKVISEFLSQQQPHPRLLSNVVFQVFQRASKQNLPLLQDWLVFSLSNFTQCLPVGMATWCLICFFISASTNEWLRALFPHVQSRIGKYEYEDRKMLCITGSDFYRQLTNESQKKKFVETFESVVDVPGTPFKDLLLSL